MLSFREIQFATVEDELDYTRMKHESLILIIFVLGISSGFAQTAGINSSEKDTLPVIRFDRTIIDLGTIQYGENDTYWFKFENAGKKPLVVTSVITSCGCIASSWPRAPIQSGKTDSIKVIYNTREDGYFSKSISVYSNAKNSPVFLKVKGQVEPRENNR